MCVYLVWGWVCCFKQKTAYERRISDWSTDVWSSDLVVVGKAARDLRDMGKAVIDERNPREFAARELAVDGRVVGRFDELVGVRRDRREREGEHGQAGHLDRKSTRLNSSH